LQTDIDKLTKLVENSSTSRPQAEVVKSLQADVVKLTKLVEDCSTNNSTILEITKVQQKNIDSSTLNTAGLLEMKDSMVILASHLDELNDQVKTNLEPKTHIAATNRKQTENGLSVAKISEEHISTQPNQMGFYSPTSHDTTELTNGIISTTNGRQTGISPLITNIPGAVKDNQPSQIELCSTTSDNPVELANQTDNYNSVDRVESELEISAIQQDKLHLETQLQSRSSPAEMCNLNRQPSSPISSANTPTTGLVLPTTSGQDSATTAETSSAPVLNSPVKEEITQIKPQSNCYSLTKASKSATIPNQDNCLSPNAFSYLQSDQNVIFLNAIYSMRQECGICNIARSPIKTDIKKMGYKSSTNFSTFPNKGDRTKGTNNRTFTVFGTFPDICIQCKNGRRRPSLSYIYINIYIYIYLFILGGV
jgi:hypothetical protein